MILTVVPFCSGLQTTSTRGCGWSWLLSHFAVNCRQRLPEGVGDLDCCPILQWTADNIYQRVWVILTVVPICSELQTTSTRGCGWSWLLSHFAVNCRQRLPEGVGDLDCCPNLQWTADNIYQRVWVILTVAPICSELQTTSTRGCGWSWLLSQFAVNCRQRLPEGVGDLDCCPNLQWTADNAYQRVWVILTVAPICSELQTTSTRGSGWSWLVPICSELQTSTRRSGWSHNSLWQFNTRWGKK